MDFLKKERIVASIATICLLLLAGLSCMMQEQEDEPDIAVQAFVVTATGETYMLQDEDKGIFGTIREKLSFLPFVDTETIENSTDDVLVGIGMSVALTINNIPALSQQVLDWTYGYRATVEVYDSSSSQGAIPSDATDAGMYGIEYNETTPANSTFNDCRAYGTGGIANSTATNWQIGEMTHNSVTDYYLILKDDLKTGSEGDDYFYDSSTDKLYIGLHFIPYASAPTWHINVAGGNQTLNGTKPDMYYISINDSTIFNRIKSLGDVYDGKAIKIKAKIEIIISDGTSTTYASTVEDFGTYYYKDGNVYLPSTSTITIIGDSSYTEPV